MANLDATQLPGVPEELEVIRLMEEIRLINQLRLVVSFHSLQGVSTMPVVQDFLHQQYAVNGYFYKCMLYIYIIYTLVDLFQQHMQNVNVMLLPPHGLRIFDSKDQVSRFCTLIEN